MSDLVVDAGDWKVFCQTPRWNPPTADAALLASYLSVEGRVAACGGEARP